MGLVEVPLEQRQAEYARAELAATRTAEVWLEAKASRRMTPDLRAQMDRAEAELRRAKRRLEQTERRLARKAAA